MSDDTPSVTDVPDATLPEDRPDATTADLPPSEDRPDATTADLPTPGDRPEPTDRITPPADTGIVGLRVLSHGIVTVGGGVQSTGNVRILEQGFEYGSRICATSAGIERCWIGGIVP